MNDRIETLAARLAGELSQKPRYEQRVTQHELTSRCAVITLQRQTLDADPVYLAALAREVIHAESRARDAREKLDEMNVRIDAILTEIGDASMTDRLRFNKLVAERQELIAV